MHQVGDEGGLADPLDIPSGDLPGGLIRLPPARDPMAENDVPQLLRALQYRVKGESTCWKSRCYGPLLQLQDREARWRKGHRGAGTASSAKGGDNAQGKDPMHLLYACSLRLRDSQRENDADDLEAMADELLGLAEGPRKGLPGKARAFPSVAVITLLTHLARLDHLEGVGVLEDISKLSPQFTDGQVEPILPPDAQLRVVRRRAEVIHPKSFFQDDHGGAGFTLPMDIEEHVTASGLLDNAWTTPLHDTTLFSSLRSRGGLCRRGLTDLSLRLSLPMPSAEEDGQPFPDCADALLRELDNDNARPTRHYTSRKSDSSHGREGSKRRDIMDESNSRAEEEHAVGSGAIIAVQEEGDAGLGCVGWEASCQYHRRDPSLWPALAPPKVPPLLTQDGVEGFESVIPAFLEQNGEDVLVVDERTLVEQCLLALRAIPSDAFMLDRVAWRVCPTAMQIRVPGTDSGSIRRLLHHFAMAGTCFFRLESLIEEALREQEGRGQVLQAFMHALHEQLALHHAHLNDIDDLLLPPPQDHTTAEPPQPRRKGASCLLTTVPPPPTAGETHKAAQTLHATLLRAISYSRGLRARIRFLASLCQCLPADEEEVRAKRRQPWTPAHALLHFPAGSALLSHLFRACRHAQASCPSAASGLPRGLRSSWKRQRSTGGREVGVDSTYATVRWLFHRAAAPYLALLAKWLYQGWVDEADDPAGEFVLHCRRSWHLDMGSGTSFLTDTFHPPPPLLLAHVGLPQQTPTLPAFFTPALAQRILLAGKLLHLLSLAHSPFYHSCALQPPPLLGVVGSSAGDSRAPSRVEGLVDDMRREEDAKLQEDRRQRIAAREKEREIVRQLETEMLRRIEEAQGKKYEQRRVLLAQIREKELEKGEQRRLEISEYKEEERRRSEEEKAELRKAQEELQAKYALLVAEAEKRVALALWRSERIDRKRAAREALRSRLLDDERQWALERGHAFEPTTSLGADLDVHAPLSPATTASLPSPPSLLPSPSARDDGPSPSDRPLSSFSTYTAASDLTEASFSGIRVSQAPGGGSTQVAAVLTSPSPTTTASLSSHTIAADPEGLLNPSPSHGARGHEEPSFSGIRVKQPPGGGSAQMTGIFAAEKDGSQVANLPRGNPHNEESRDSGLHEEAEGRERRSSFSGIRVNQQPGGSSAHVAGILGGNRSSEETQEQADERWHPQESGRRGAGASPANGLEGEEEQAASAFFMHDEGDADAAAFFAHDDEAALLDRFDEDETAQAAYPIRSVDGASAIETPPRARPPLSPSSLHEALVAESRSRGSTPTATSGASDGTDATADARGVAVVSPSQDPQGPNGSVQQSESEEGRQRRPSFSGIRVRQEPGGHSNQVAALLSDEATQERAPSRLSTSSSPSFSGKQIVQPPGGSSAHVANLLWGQEGTKGQPLQRLHHRVDTPILGDEDTNSEGALNAARREEGHRQRMEKEAQERNALMIWRCEGVKARLADCDLLDRSLAICHMLPPQDHNPLPLEVMWQDTVGHLVEEQCHRVEKAALAFLIHEAHVGAHLHALRTYLLGSETTVVRDFVRSLQSRWERMHALEWTRPSNALYCFNEATSVAGLEHDPRKQYFTYILSMQQATASSQLDLIDSLQPCYTAPWPLGLVVTEAALQKYYGLHRLLLRLHWTAGLVQRCFAQVRAADKARDNGSNACRGRKLSSTLDEGGLAFRSAYVLLHALAALANAVLEHVVTQVEGECWGAFRSALQDCERGEGGVMPLRDAHEAYVTEVASRCFIDSEEEIDDCLRELGPWICQACLTIETVVMSTQGTLEDGMGLMEQTSRLKMEMGQRLVNMHAALRLRRKRSAHLGSVRRAHGRDYLDALDSRIGAMVAPLV